ncbi:MAG: peptidoglycan-binding protein, partial [Oscillospiraceae bacterium]|nr:peptidoglycan-binding protein [Oscillospiraceae bacterium]
MEINSMIAGQNDALLLLESRGFYDGGDPTDGIRSFQSEFGLPITGKLDEATIARLDDGKPATNPIETCAEPCVQPCAEPCVQTCAEPENLPVSAPETILPQPQSARTTPSENPLLSYGSYGGEVTRLQETLNMMGYYPWTVDGSFGSGTYGAVTAFQMEMGLRCDGIVGAKTWAALSFRQSVRRQETDIENHTENDVTKEPNRAREHTVAPGDSIYRVAERHGVHPAAVMRANGMDSTALSVGRVLVIP